MLNGGQRVELAADRRGHAGHNNLRRQDQYDVRMTLEYLEVMEEVKRKKCVKSFKSNTRVFDDDSILMMTLSR